MLARPIALCALWIASVAAPALAAPQWSPWHALGPFDHPGGAGDIATPQAPERALRELALDGVGFDFAKREKGKGGAWIGWTKLVGEAAERVDLDVGLIDLNVALTPPAEVERWNENAVVYLYRQYVAEEDATLALALGSDDGMRLWWNGELLIDRAVGRPTRIGDEVLDLPVRKGTNHLLVKVANGGGGWGFGMAPWTRVPQSEIDAAIDAGVAQLLKHQLLDGSWAKHEAFGSGQTAYAVYTLLKCELPWRHPAVQRGMAWVRARPSDYTYATSCELLAACELEKLSLGEARLRPYIEERLRVLIDMQSSNGLWAYPVHPDGERHPEDLSNTLYAALALRAARELDLAVPERTWRRMVDGTLLCIESRADKKLRADATPAAFGYRLAGEAARGSTTTAGISVLAIGAAAVQEGLPQQTRDRVEGARASALAWIRQHMVWTEGPGGGFHYFWIYGIERVGGLLGLNEIGGQDWYWTGAEYLVDKQLDSGAWVGDEEYVDTILALLFLKRATMTASGRKQDRFAKSWAADGPEAQVALRASGDTPFSVWVVGFPEQVIERFEWPGERGQGLHVASVEFLARPADGSAEYERIGYELGDAASAAGVKRFAALHDFPHNGAWHVIARAQVVPPPVVDGASGEPTMLESPVLEVAIDNVLDAVAMRYATDGERNLLVDVRARASASSQNGDQLPEKAIDGHASTRWHSDVADAQPWIELSLSRAVRADRVLLTHAWPRGTHPSAPRPMTVELALDDESRFMVQMDPDPLAKTIVELGEPRRVRTLRITILQSLDRVVGTDSVGFAEIELQEGE